MYVKKQDGLEIKFHPEYLNLAKQAIAEVLKIDILTIDETKYIEVGEEKASQINIRYSQLVGMNYPTKEIVEGDRVADLEQQIEQQNKAISDLTMMIAMTETP